jgi:hypothetical protein
MKLFYSSIFLFLSIHISAQNMLVSDTESTNQTVSELVENWLSKKDIILTEIDYYGNNKSMGTFSNGVDAVGISNGMILTTGRARTTGTEIGADALSQESADSDFFWFHNPSDARNIPPTTDTARNAVVLSLRFKALTDTIYLDYVFGSEDYQNYDCLTGDDYFGIIMSGPGYEGNYNFNGELVSLMPDSSPIRVSTVHPETDNCPENYEDFYHETPFNQQPVYHGLTSRFTTALAVETEGIYRLKFLIADGQNEANDAGLFFNLRTCSEPICLLEDLKPTTLLEDCSDTIITFDFSSFPEVLPLNYSLTGTALPAVDYPNQPTFGTATIANPVFSLDLSVFDDGEDEYVEDIRLNLTDSTGASKEYLWLVGDKSEDLFLNRDEVCGGIGFTDNRGRNVRIESEADNTIVETFDFNYEFNEDVITTSQRFDFEVSGVPFDYLYSPYQIDSFCVYISGDNTSYNFSLFAPNGQRMQLANGLRDDDVYNCCFSPKANFPIGWSHYNTVVSPAPYTGTWQPHGNWEDLKYSAVNGTWSLYLTTISPDEIPNAFVEDVSISFRQSTIPYLPLIWSDGQNQTVRMVNESDASTEDNILTVNLLGNNCVWSDTLYFSETNISQNNIIIPVCQTDTVWFEGIAFSSVENRLNGLFLFENATIDGCDSIVQIVLDIEGDKGEFNYYELPQDSSIIIGNTIISDYGFYSINTISQTGCDSLSLFSVLPPSSSPAPNENISGLMISSVFESCDTHTDVCIQTGIGGYLNDNNYLINGNVVSNSNNTPLCVDDTTLFKCYLLSSNTSRLFRMPIDQLGVENESPYIYFNDVSTLTAGLNYLQYPENYWFTIQGDSKLCSYETIEDDLVYERAFIGQNDLSWSETTMFPQQITVPTGVVLDFPIGENILIVEKENFSNDTVYVNVEREYPSPEAESLSITIGQFQSFLYPLDDSELCGDIVSIEFCNNPNPDDIIISLSPESGDLSVYTLELGPQEICIQYCDSLNICDELLLIVNVVDESNTTDEIADLTQLKIYPNPVSDKLQIELNPLFSLEQVDVFSTLGQKVNSFNPTANSFKFSVLDYSSGVYFLKIKTNIGVTKKKIMIIRD